MDDNIVVVGKDKHNVPIEYMRLATFMADNGNIYVALVPLRHPKGGKNKREMIVRFFRSVIFEDVEHIFLPKTVEEYVLAARAYFEHLSAESANVEELEEA